MRRSKQIFSISFTALLYVIHLIFIGLSKDEEGNSIFPNTSQEYQRFLVEITPSPGTFSIQGLSCALMVLWIIYAITTIFRDGDATNILRTSFYLCFNVSVIFSIICNLVYARDSAIGFFICMVMTLLFLDLSLYFAFSYFHDYTSSHDESSSNDKIDVFCQRFFVQNGILFFWGWTMAYTMTSTAGMFKYELGVSSEASSIIALIILTIITLAWFLLENVTLCAYSEYSFSVYLALIWYHSGVHQAVWGKNEAVGIFNLILLIMSCILFVVRVVILCYHSSKKRSYENIAYNAQEQTVSA